MSNPSADCLRAGCRPLHHASRGPPHPLRRGGGVLLKTPTGIETALPERRNDRLAGAVFIAFGLAFGLEALLRLPIGSALRMGPGYFPLLLAGLLIFVGLAVAFIPAGAPETPPGPVPWRGLVFVLPAPVIFGATVRGLGLVVSVALLVIITAFASRKASLCFAVLLAIALTAFCVGLFHYGLGLPLRLFGPWTGPLARLGA
jgi:hypothetical protein